MKIVEYDHRDSEGAIPETDLQNIREALTSIPGRVRSSGQTAYRAAILEELEKLGWSRRVRVCSELNLTMAAMKGRTAASVQFGNVSRLYADLMKAQLMYDTGKADGAIFVLLTHEAAKAMQSNLANSERLRRELKLFRSIVNVPIKVLSVE